MAPDKLRGEVVTCKRCGFALVRRVIWSHTKRAEPRRCFEYRGFLGERIADCPGCGESVSLLTFTLVDA